MKKILFSLICAFAMSMTAFAATETTVYYAIPDATVGTYTVKLNVCLQWDKPDPNQEPVAVWQQFDMQKTDKTFNANPIYKVTFTDKWDGANTMQFQLYDGEQWKSQEVAFDGSSNGEWTTADTYNGKMRVFGTDGWQAYQEDGAVTPDPKTVTLYYVNTDKWENVNAYVWYTEGETNHEKAAWAGEAMTKTEDQVNGFDVYSYTFAETYTKVIFNDGDKNQTTDLTWNSAEPYFYGDKWYAALKDIPAEGGETPTPDFGIMVNDKDYYAGVKNEEYKDAGTEYVVTITLAVNDKFKNYDNVNKAAWQVALDGAGYQFTSDEGYYVVTEAGEYTFYIKIIGEGQDNMFVAKKAEEAKTVTLYYVNTNKWENVNAYVWYTEGETNHEKAAWAGEAMTKTEDQVNGFDVYSYTFAETYTKVIFNDGDKNQTTDLTWNSAEPYFYGDKWYAALKDIPAEGGETPTPDFGIMVNDKDYYAGVKNEEYKDAGTEYVVTITLAVNDKFKNYDNVNKAAWQVALDGAGYQFTSDEGYYVVTEAGEYTFYIKIIGEGQDNMFVAKKAAEITRVDYTLLNAAELANDGAKLFVHTWGDGMADEDILMTEVKDREAVVAYKAAINDLTQHLVFVRMYPEAEAIVWEGENKYWNKSDDLARCAGNQAYFTGWEGDIFKVSCDEPTGFETIEQDVENGKVIYDGVLYIIRDGKRYNAQGVEVK